MLLLLVASALAGIEDVAGLGGTVEVDDSGDVAAGPALASGTGAFRADIVLGPATPVLPVVRAWDVAVGCSVPLLMPSSKREQRSESNQAPAGRHPPGPPPKPKDPLVLGGPCLGLHGDAWAGDALRVDLGGDGLINLLKLADVPSREAWSGPSFGARSVVRYPSAGGAGTGELLLSGGLGGGGQIDDVFLGRAEAHVDWEPATLSWAPRAEVLLLLSLVPEDVPLFVQVRGSGGLDPAAAFAPDGQLAVMIGYAPT